LVAELRKSRESVPSSVMKDLRSAKTMIEILKVDPSRSEHLLRIEEYLNNVESYLAPAAREKFGQEYVDQWMERVVEARKSDQPWEAESTRRFPVGIPRAKTWVRMESSREMPEERIEQLAEEGGLGFRTEKDGYVLIYGEEARLKRFVRKTAELLREGRRSFPSKTQNKQAEEIQRLQQNCSEEQKPCHI